MKGFVVKGPIDLVVIQLSAICEYADGMTVSEYIEKYEKFNKNIKKI